MGRSERLTKRVRTRYRAKRNAVAKGNRAAQAIAPVPYTLMVPGTIGAKPAAAATRGPVGSIIAAKARRAVYNHRARLRSGVAKEAFRLRAELVERSFALTLDRGGVRRAWWRGRENLQKRCLVHVAGYNLGLVMRLLVGAGTRKGVPDRRIRASARSCNSRRCCPRHPHRRHRDRSCTTDAGFRQRVVKTF